MTASPLAAIGRAHGDLSPLGGEVPPEPACFMVEELMAPPAPPPGDAPARWLWTEREGLDTHEVAARLAAALGVHRNQVRWAGRKDRHAISRQWFSLPAGPAEPGPGEIDGIRILDLRPAAGPLRLGSHRGNRFVLRLRGSDREPGRLAAWQERLGAGVPNLFGPQRFGAAGDNAAAGEALLRADRGPAGRRGRFLLNAWQSDLFNRAVDRWLDAGRPEHEADLVWHPAAAEALPRSARPKGIATGPLFGSKMAWPGGPPRQREEAVLSTAGWSRDGIEAAAGRQRLFGARRPMWVVPEELSLAAAGTDVELRMELPVGSYATAVLRELTGHDRPRGPAAAGASAPVPGA